jgi:hypothetical protein
MSLAKSALELSDYWFSHSVADMDWNKLDQLILTLRDKAQPEAQRVERNNSMFDRFIYKRKVDSQLHRAIKAFQQKTWKLIRK